MKKIIVLLISVYLYTSPLAAQNPTADTIPQLKEWWRADNMQYAKYGMTWLDNFYQGKGALVVWTPQGVKTWLLRFPGDTMNVFTWEKGSSNISTGDFNGDGIRDYIDENGYIYEGIQNGEPPKAAVSGQGFKPSLVSDVNGDGYDDMLASNAVVFGKKDLSSLKTETFTLAGIDSNNAPIASYMVSKNEMRIICRHYYWTNNVNFPFRTVYKDGLRLVRVWWDGSGFKSEVLDEFTVDVANGREWYNGGVLFQPSSREFYWLGSSDTNKLTVYSLNNNRLEKLYTTLYNGGVLRTLRHSIDQDSIPDFYAWRLKSGICTIKFYNGRVENRIEPITEYVTDRLTTLVSVPDITGDSIAELALSNEYDISSAKIKYRFSILTLKDSSTSAITSESEVPTFSVQVLPPLPVKKSSPIRLRITTQLPGAYTITLYNSIGKLATKQSIEYLNFGDTTINVELPYNKIESGVYRIVVEGQGKSTQLPVTIY